MSTSVVLSDWSNEMVLEFLELYQAEPVLYDVNNPDRKDKLKVNDAWIRIQNDFSAYITVAEMKRKKDSLMASFRQISRKKKASMQSGANSDVYKPSWYAYDLMEKFLGPFYLCDTEKSTPHDEDTLERDEESAGMDENSSTYDDARSPTPQPQLPSTSSTATERSNRKLKELRRAKRQMDQAASILQNVTQTDDEECELYGKLVTKKLKKIPESERDQIMYEIDGVLLKARKRHQNHSVSTRATSPVEIYLPNRPSECSFIDT